MLFVFLLLPGLAHAECRLPTASERIVSVRFPAGQEHCSTREAARKVAEAPRRDSETFEALKRDGICGELGRPMWFYSIGLNGERIQSRDPTESPRWVYAMCEMRPDADVNAEKHFIINNPGL